jgi:hypothetical protein
VLLTNEDTSIIWSPSGEHEITDATPERTTSRTFILETMGFKVNETNLRRLGTEFPRQYTRDVCISRVRPESVPNTTPIYYATWTTWTELISPRRTGYLVLGNKQYPLRYETLENRSTGG